jgi:hypothetical protein
LATLYNEPAIQQVPAIAAKRVVEIPFYAGQFISNPFGCICLYHIRSCSWHQSEPFQHLLPCSVAALLSRFL